MYQRLFYGSFKVIVFSLAIASVSARDGHCTSSKVSNVRLGSESADFTIGAFTNMHYKGSSGLYGCSQVDKKSMEVYHAFRWMLNVLNRDGGSVFEHDVQDSFIPGIKLGMDVYDSCGHSNLAVQQLSKYLPKLESGQDSCLLNSNQTLSSQIGLLDMTDMVDEQGVVDVLRNFYVPRIAVGRHGSLPSHYQATVLIKVMNELRWTNMVVIHEQDEYSISTVKALGQLSSRANICISSVHSIPTIKQLINPTNQDMRQYHKVIKGVTDAGHDSLGVVVIGHGRSTQLLLRALAEASSITVKLQWLFSSVINPSHIPSLPQVINLINENRIYSLAPYPGGIDAFDEYWNEFDKSDLEQNSENKWNTEYKNFEESCKDDDEESSNPHCDDLILKETSLEKLVRRSTISSSVDGLLTYAHALKAAWQQRCQSVPGVCSSLAKMTNKDFLEQYMKPLTFAHSVNDRSPPGFNGKKTASIVPGQVTEVKMALTMYRYNEKDGFTYEQVLLYNEGKISRLNSDFVLTPSLCSEGKCIKCVSIRQSRLLESSVNHDVWMYPSKSDVLIPVLLPIHKRGDNPRECGREINSLAIQNLEALTWTIDKINGGNFIPGVKIGTVVLDTCSSTLKIADHISRIYNGKMTIGEETIDAESIVAFVTTTAEDHETAVSMLAPMNVTSVSITQVHTLLGRNFYNYQVPLPLSVTAGLLSDLLLHKQWTFVSMVGSYDPDSAESADFFRLVARDNGLCVAEDIVLGESVPESPVKATLFDDVIMRLKSAKDRGASFVVLWTSIADTRDLFAATKRAVENKLLDPDDLRWIGTNVWGGHLNIVNGYEDVTKGAIVVSPESGEILDFISYYVRLNLEYDAKNHWLEQFWGQILESCENGPGPGCPFTAERRTPGLRYVKTPGVRNMMQAIWTITSGLKRLRDFVCPSKSGLCIELDRRSDKRYLLNHYIQHTPAPIPDNSRKRFHFTEDGYGNTPTVIWNFKDVNKKFKYYKFPFKYGTPLVVYESSIQIPAARVASECKNHCQLCNVRPRHIFVRSPDNVYLTAIFPVHKQHEGSLGCGDIETAYGIQNMEAFLWALDVINHSPTILPGIKIGAIGLDTCSSKEKTARDVYDLFTNSNELGFSVRPHQITGIIAGSTDKEIEAVLSVSRELGVTTITPDATMVEPDKSSKLVTFALSNDMRARTLTRILQQYHWTYVSVVYLAANKFEADIYRHLKRETEKVGIQLALEDGIVDDTANATHLNTIASRLVRAKEDGAGIVVTILPPKILYRLLDAVSSLPTGGGGRKTHLMWAIMDNDARINDLPQFALGSLIVRPRFGHISLFDQYFTSLRVENNTRNVWFREYMAGPGKFVHNLLDHGKSVVNTISAVYAFVQALDKVRRDMCPRGSLEICDAMSSGDKVIREATYNYMTLAQFQGSDFQRLKISSDGRGSGYLEVLNYQKSKDDRTSVFAVIGEFSDEEGLVMNSTLARGYDSSSHERDLSKYISKCVSDSCESNRKLKRTSVMSSDAKFTIGGLISVHHHDKDFFKCGKLDDVGFQNVAAMAFAVDSINDNKTLLFDNDVGLMIFDYCDRPERAQQQLFGYFMEQEKDNLIGALTSDTLVAETVSPILEANDILQFVSPDVSTSRNDGKRTYFQSLQTKHPYVTAIVDLLIDYDWKYVTVVHSDSRNGAKKVDAMTKEANDHDICVTKTVTTKRSMSTEELKVVVNEVIRKDESRVVVVMVDTREEVRSLLRRIGRDSRHSSLLWIFAGSWANSKTFVGLEDSIEGSIVVNFESKTMTEFSEYFATFTPERHEPIPDDWFEEFWQETFGCQLAYSRVANTEATRHCTGNERLDSTSYDRVEDVFSTVKSLQAIAAALHNFLRDNCRVEFQTLKDCGPEAHRRLAEELEKVIKSKDRSDESFSILNYQLVKGRYELKNVGSWRNDKLEIDKNEMRFKTDIRSGCEDSCDYCFRQLATHNRMSKISGRPLDENFSTIWGLIATSLSLLGMLLVIICVLYFLMAFPISTGTTVIGYLILFGILLLYGSNFAFIVGPTVTTCGIRRTLTGFAYSVILAGMLVKSFNTWRLKGGKNQDLKYQTRLTKPSGLLVIALGLVLIQIVLVTAWMILMPSEIELFQETYCCSPGSKFETDLFISLTYCALLLFLTLLFSGLSWNCQENHHESRWIFACGTLISVMWTLWMILGTKLKYDLRNPVTVVANITCATLIMLLLYMRKVYLYSKFSKQIKDYELTTHLKSNPFGAAVYGTCHRNNGIAVVPEFMRGSQASLSSDFTFEVAPNSTMTDVTSDGRSTRSSGGGSIQVQGTDLYPMEVYDGGSQFQAHNLSCNSRRALFIDELKS